MPTVLKPKLSFDQVLEKMQPNALIDSIRCTFSAVETPEGTMMEVTPLCDMPSVLIDPSELTFTEINESRILMMFDDGPWSIIQI